jgi:hypothetical protein
MHIAVFLVQTDAQVGAIDAVRPSGKPVVQCGDHIARYQAMSRQSTSHADDLAEKVFVFELRLAAYSKYCSAVTCGRDWVAMRQL